MHSYATQLMRLELYTVKYLGTGFHLGWPIFLGIVAAIILASITEALPGSLTADVDLLHTISIPPRLLASQLLSTLMDCLGS